MLAASVVWNVCTLLLSLLHANNLVLRDTFPDSRGWSLYNWWVLFLTLVRGRHIDARGGAGQHIQVP